MRSVLALLALAAGLASGVRQVKRRDGWGSRTRDALARMERSLKSLVFSSSGKASMETLGETAQSHSVWAVRLREKAGAHATKKVLITFNLRPRGAAGADMAKYAVRELQTRVDLLHDMEVVVVPMANPDGFELAQSSLRRQGWTKNAPATTRRDGCTGVRLNRNFAKGWSKGSSDKCSQEYPGSSALSELETQALAEELKAGVALHINVDLSDALEVGVGYDCKGCGYPSQLRQLFRLGGEMTTAMTAVKRRRHRTSMARQGTKAGTITDFALAQGVLAVDLRSSSKEECLKGLVTAIQFAKNNL